MGSSMRKKKEKAQDFKKPKLRVGKAKAKPDNFTDTSFKSKYFSVRYAVQGVNLLVWLSRAFDSHENALFRGSPFKAIVINNQSLSTNAPSSSTLFSHYLSLATNSKTETQRRDALSYLTSRILSLPLHHSLEVPTSVLLPKILPLVLDGSAPVRNQLLKLLRSLPPEEIGDHAECALLYVRAGMTHLAIEIRTYALAVLEWLLEIASEDILNCPGGWFKTLKCFMSMMGWIAGKETSKWTSNGKVSLGKVAHTFPRQLNVLAQFLEAGLVESEDAKSLAAEDKQNRLARDVCMYPLIDLQRNMIPTESNAFSHLNLFGIPRNEEDEMYSDRETRRRVLGTNFLTAMRIGVGNARKEGGEIGRAAAIVEDILKRVF
ncbi:BgTH12-03302 [Blumeria graminis f. sp. triticale]|uniref:Pre-rRNA-processing protein n=4 Tax=Blumeria graminis TaxID=34373 RepID=A0A656KJ16_BLUGR|nr:component of the Rix1 complex [Blumeria graminis f. sp. tritici 96224]CAD6503643.1 BgTH12-03302 [Blumeria graminis f. sp. triticale]VDB89823.1 Bgt-2017 [Blumeria graminis f. sp. tritici]